MNNNQIVNIPPPPPQVPLQTTIVPPLPLSPFMPVAFSQEYTNSMESEYMYLQLLNTQIKNTNSILKRNVCYLENQLLLSDFNKTELNKKLAFKTQQVSNLRDMLKFVSLEKDEYFKVAFDMASEAEQIKLKLKKLDENLKNLKINDSKQMAELQNEIINIKLSNDKYNNQLSSLWHVKFNLMKKEKDKKIEKLDRKTKEIKTELIETKLNNNEFLDDFESD